VHCYRGRVKKQREVCDKELLSVFHTYTHILFICSSVCTSISVGEIERENPCTLEWQSKQQQLCGEDLNNNTNERDREREREKEYERERVGEIPFLTIQCYEVLVSSPRKPETSDLDDNKS